jgi:diaminopimelate epimerase
MNVAEGRVSFMAYDGLHEAWSNGDEISVTMRDVGGIEREDSVFIMDTGSPHYVKFVEDLEEIDVFRTGRSIRNIARFRADGINVNFVEVQRDRLRVSTYERGVEDQTLACGTGVTAVALAYGLRENISQGPVEIRADGGDLKVDFRREGELFTEVVLTGPASHVFDGEWPLNRPFLT